MPETLEMDSLDESSFHLVAACPAGIVGTARLYPESGDTWHVGRVAVLLVWRGRGVGEGLMDLAAATARERGAKELTLNAQLSVIPFYERLGYIAEGETFLDAGIEHRTMRRALR